MSFLAGRLAAIEGAYFHQESKLAVGRLAQKNPPPSSSSAASPEHVQGEEEAADVLPEILKHSVPLKGTFVEPADPSISTSSKWLLGRTSSPQSPSSSIGALNPLRDYVSLPQATFGPKRWQPPNEHTTFSASTANELRQDRYTAIDSKKLKALAVGYSQVGKAFVVATTIVFGGATAAFVYTAHKLQMESPDDIRTKGRDLILPRANMLREQMIPLRTWAEDMSKKWHIEEHRAAEEKTLVKELSKKLGKRIPG